jgi:DEAD/DEAH box helicase domain-containing protein
VFGCHAALVLRRLRRLCARTYASAPLFVVTSATIANPLEHAALLLGLGHDQLLLVDEDGSPHGPKDFVLWNPPLTAEAQQVNHVGLYIENHAFVLPCLHGIQTFVL